MRGNFELAKWAALALMFGDHVNKALFAGELPVLSELARVVMPLFAMILGANLARAPDDAKLRTLLRLCVFAMLAQPFFVIALDVPPTKLNILFGFAAGVAVLAARTPGQQAIGWALVVIIGALVEYTWAAPLLVIASARFWRYGQETWGAVACALLLFLSAIQGSFAPVLAPALLVLFAMLPAWLPRMRDAFYTAYPAHLAALAILTSWSA